jgi:upstream activation factor subunit UAF30
MELSEKQRSQYAVHIDKILGESDLKTISNKKVRNKLQEIVDQDLSEKKVSRSFRWFADDAS